ncbi:MAG TPA: hypothetical protein VL403_03700 [Candidatus Kryptonia bacterium]|nr:hypothetical protein [Candidatus Kryptonia bacterium]
MGEILLALGYVATVVLVATAMWDFSRPHHQRSGWWVALAAVLSAVTWQWRVPATDWTQADARRSGLVPQSALATQWWRRILGGVLALGGGVLWFDATHRLSINWDFNFDRAWLSWVVAAVVMSFGLHVAQAPAAPSRAPRWQRIALFTVVVVGTVLRLAYYQHYPPNDGVSQVEELQAGQFGTQFLAGYRGRWEFLGPMWLAAIGIWIGGPSLRATRMTSSVFSSLKIAPAYFWFCGLAGPAGGVIGTAVLALSGWDNIVARVSGQPDGLVTMCCWALLVGSAVRGRWAAYPWIGLLGGYSASTYIAYRPLVGCAIVGVVIANLATYYASRWRSLARALAALLVVTSLIGGMFYPFTRRLHSHFAFEYLNGWNRALGNEEYYSPTDSWSQMLEKRWERAAMAAALFYTQGDINATHNVNSRPLVDAVTGGLLLLGIAYCAVRCLRGFYGLVLAIFAITFYGTLIATGNFDVLRAQAMIPYVYALAAVGAGSLIAGAEWSFGRFGRYASVVALGAAVLWSGYWNGALLHDLWTSPLTRQHYRSDLTYLSTWVREHAGGERVIGLIPSNSNVVFMENDASWLRGRDVRGESTWDVNQTLQKLAAGEGEAMLLIGASTSSADLAEYFEYRLPGLKMEIRLDDTSGAPRMAFARLQLPPPALQSPAGLAADCRGVHAQFNLLRADRSPIATIDQTIPVIDAGTWPGALRIAVQQNERDASKIAASWSAEFTVTEPGEYIIAPQSYEGPVVATIDETRVSSGASVPVTLAAGTHHFEMHGEFTARILEPMARVSWATPSVRGELHLVPFYRVAEPDAACTAAVSASLPPAQ